MPVTSTDGLVLSYLGLRHEASVPELCGHFGVPASTVTGSVARLERQGLVSRQGMVGGSRGRPRIVYRMRLPGPVIACTLEGTELDGALVSTELEPISVAARSVPHVEDLPDAVRLVASVCDALRRDPAAAGCEPAGLSLSVNAVQTERRVLMSSVLPWASDELAAAVERETGLPTELVSAAEMHAWAAYQRLDSPTPEAVCFNVADGVSAHMIMAGSYVSGASSLAGEIGHLIVDPNGPLCGCGQNGCLETYCSGPAIQATVLSGLRSGVTSSLPVPEGGTEPPRLTLDRLWDAWNAGDTFARSVMDRVLDKLAWALGVVMNVVDPSCTIVGGYVLQGRQAWIDEVARRAARWTLKSASRRTRIVASTLERADVLRVVASRHFFEPSGWRRRSRRAGGAPAARERGRHG